MLYSYFVNDYRPFSNRQFTISLMISCRLFCSTMILLDNSIESNEIAMYFVLVYSCEKYESNIRYLYTIYI